MTEWVRESITAAPFHVSLAYLAIGAVGKLRSPEPAARVLISAGTQPRLAMLSFIRAVSVIELLAVVAGVGLATRLGAAMAAAMFVAFAGVTATALSRGLTDCGCMGAVASPPDVAHVVVNLACALVGSVVAVRGTLSVADVVSERPVVGIAYLVAVGCAAALVVAVVTSRSQVAQLVASAGAARSA